MEIKIWRAQCRRSDEMNKNNNLLAIAPMAAGCRLCINAGTKITSCGDAVVATNTAVAASIAAGHSLTLMFRNFMNSVVYCVHH